MPIPSFPRFQTGAIESGGWAAMNRAARVSKRFSRFNVGRVNRLLTRAALFPTTFNGTRSKQVENGAHRGYAGYRYRGGL
jgi:hypothetical protein